MLRIAICDDMPEERVQTHALLDGYLSRNRIAVRVQEFASGRRLLNTVMEEGPFDIYILDIVMPVMNGIDLGKELRRIDSEGTIIYLSASPDYALESYQTRAFYYLLKPVSEEQFCTVLEDAVQRRRKWNENGIQVKTRDGMARLQYDNIVYAELRERHVRYYLLGGRGVDSMTITCPFREAVAPLLEDKRFLMCGSSFVVNLYYVKMVDKTGVILPDGQHLALPKSACASLRSAWSSYWLEGGKQSC